MRGVKQLGDLNVQADLSKLPSFEDLDPESCYLSWNMELETDVPKKEINEVFEWVQEGSAIKIAPINDTQLTETNDAQLADISPENTSKISQTGLVTSSVRVDTEKIDNLINLVGELIITGSMLNGFTKGFESDDHEKLYEGIIGLERNIRDIQEGVMQMRMVPISFCFSRLPRLVHELNKDLNKNVMLKLSGEQTELDKNVLEKISDPLIHLVRNAVDHGIESREERLAASKPENGTIHVHAYHSGGNISIVVGDDGRGLNDDIILAKAQNEGIVNPNEELSTEHIQNLVFHPGFSTAETVSDVSGSGVGMDVVRRNVQELGGQVRISANKGEGCTVIINLPLTLAIIDGQLLLAGKEIYIVPLLSILEIIQIKSKYLGTIAGKGGIYRLREEYIPILRLQDAWSPNNNVDCKEDNLLVIVESGNRKVGLLVDELLDQQQIVIKSLESNYKSMRGLSGATILGDGTVALIIDIAGIIDVRLSYGMNKDTVAA